MDVLENCIYHIIKGSLWHVDDALVMVSAGANAPQGELMISDAVALRYAIPLLSKAHLSVVPAIFVSEKGGMLHQWQAWHFALKNYQLYPRAEILGLRSDGEETQVFLRELDFGAQQRVLAYDTLQARVPLGQVVRLVVGDVGDNDLPDLPLKLLGF